MTDRGRKYLSDIQIAIELIESFLQDTETFDAYSNDLKTQSAVERQLGVIGEAVHKFRHECPEEILTHTREIISFRNRIIHAYDHVDNSIIWVILKKHIMPLKNEVMEKLTIS